MRLVLPLLALLSAACAPLPRDDAASRAAQLEGLSWQRVRADMLALSTDAMEGRYTGTPGYERAAAHVAERFAALGLQPVANAPKPHFQTVSFVESRLAHTALQIQGAGAPLTLAYPDEFVSFGGFGAASEAVTAPLSFVGYGIAAPQLGHDDYAGSDVRGRIVVVLSGAPPAFGLSERAYYSSLEGKQTLALAQGAKGLLVVQTPVDRRRSPWVQLVEAARRPNLRWRDAQGRAHAGFAELPTATLSPQGAERLFAAGALKLDEVFERYFAGRLGGFALDLSASFSRNSHQRPQSSPNVIGILPGSDPRLRDEVVLVSAHLDHLGRDPELKGDGLYNGAYDNAAGVAVVLELARLLAAHPPRRSLMFVAFTGEEQGLRGSDYLAHHPPVPIERIVANLNIDMPYLGFPIRDLEGYGAAHSSLEVALQQAAHENGLSVSPDPRPELVRLIRSDQYSFVRQGIPGLNLKPGSQSADPAIDGAAVLQQYLTRHYHQPGDDASLPFSPAAATAFTRSAGTLALILANGAERPRWRVDDFFGSRFGPAAGKQAAPPPR